MAKINNSWTLYDYLYKEKNQIGEEGCSYIVRANWNITELNLSIQNMI